MAKMKLLLAEAVAKQPAAEKEIVHNYKKIS